VKRRKNRKVCKKTFFIKEDDGHNREELGVNSIGRGGEFSPTRRGIDENDEFCLEMYPAKFLPHCP